MESSDSGHSSDDSSGSDDPERTSALPNSLLHINDAYATDPDSVFDGTPQKKFDEEDGQSDDSEFHTPAQRSKPRRLPSVSPKTWREDVVAESESDLFERDSLFDSPPKPPSSKRGFRCPRQLWSLVKEWSLDQYDKEIIYEEIKAIMEQSLEDAGSKIFARPNSNSIAGWRPKQVSILYFF
jgi:hypothetical protein